MKKGCGLLTKGENHIKAQRGVEIYACPRERVFSLRFVSFLVMTCLLVEERIGVVILGSGGHRNS